MSFSIKLLINKSGMNLYRRFVKPLELADVFTPNTTATVTYIQRSTIEEEFHKNIDIIGRQIIIYGHSGSGKTTLTRRMLKILGVNFIITHCESATTFNDLLLSAFDKLDRFYISQKESNTSYSVSASMKAEYKSMSAEISKQNTTSYSEISVRVVPPQLTPQKLAQFLGEVNAVWIIEDFHKINEDEKTRLADILKIFIDAANDYPKVKIICIGAVGSARELVTLDTNLYPRISEVHVPLLSESEIKEIINIGCRCLHIEMSDSLIEKIVFYSNQLASLTHQMCYEICFKNNIKNTKSFKKHIDDDQFKNAIQGYINNNSDTLKGIYESITKNKLVWYILKTIVSVEKEAITFEEIKSRINTKNHSFPDVDIISELNKLSEETVGILRYNSNSEKYSIATPFWGAFLKMQLAIEQAEHDKRRKNKRNKNLILKNQDDIDADVYDLLLQQLKLLKKITQS